jgi:CubicO group peptidase (beta-lactamase class C family)
MISDVAMPNRIRFVTALLALALSPFFTDTVRSGGNRADPLAGLDDFVTSAMAEWQVPGLAIGIIADGRVKVAKAYGRRDRERDLPVTIRTVMPIASATKSFTALLIGMLVDEKKLDWDRPLRDYLPDFRMWDDYATEYMTPRDLLTHRSGLPQHDRMWKGRSFTRLQLFERLRYLEPNTSFRERFQYQNLMVVTAGVLAERVTGKSWEVLVRERLFAPLGMSRSSTSVSEIVKEDDFAQPYMPMDGKTVRVPFLNIDNVGPAGGINSSVEDMLKYLQCRLDLGTADGRSLVSRATTELTQTAQIIAPTPADTPELELGAYGLGLAIESYKGHKIVHHSGGIDGFIAEVGWMPRERIALVILTNRSGNPVPQMVSRHVYDRLLRLPPTDWKARRRLAEKQAAARADAARQKLEQERKPGAPPASDLSAYAGTYDHPGYGRMSVRNNGGTIEIAFDKFVVRLKPYHYDVFEVNTEGEIPGIVPIRGLVRFERGVRGRINRLLIPFEPALPDIVFQRP